MKKTKIPKLICTVLAAAMLILPVCSAYPEPDMTDPIEQVVRLGKYSSKIDPTLPFDESCVVLYLSKPVSEASPYNKLNAKDLPFLELESVEYVPTPEDYRAPDIYLLHLKKTGRREVAEAIVNLENNYRNVDALKNLPENMVVPCPAISPKYDYLDLDGKFTRNLFEDRYTFLNSPDIPILDFEVYFKNGKNPGSEKTAEELFPEIASEIEKTVLWSDGTGCSLTLKSQDGILTYPETLCEQWMRVYNAISKLNHRTEDIKRIDIPDFELYESPLEGERYYVSDYGKNDWFSESVGYVRNWHLMKSESFSIKGPITVKNELTGEEKTVVESEDVKIYLNKFYPHMGMTRAMLVTVLFRMSNYPYGSDSTSVFDDVPEGQWYTEAVKWAYENGIVEGIGDNSFAPDREITREEFVTIMLRYHAEWNNSPVRYKADYESFKDSAEVSDWAGDAMSWAVGNLLISGRDGGVIAPTDSITRAEAAKIIMRYDDYVPKK